MLGLVNEPPPDPTPRATHTHTHAGVTEILLCLCSLDGSDKCAAPLSTEGRLLWLISLAAQELPLNVTTSRSACLSDHSVSVCVCVCVLSLIPLLLLCPGRTMVSRPPPRPHCLGQEVQKCAGGKSNHGRQIVSIRFFVGLLRYFGCKQRCRNSIF